MNDRRTGARRRIPLALFAPAVAGYGLQREPSRAEPGAADPARLRRR